MTLQRLKHPTFSTPQRRRGQALTEFIMVFPIMVLLVFGIMQIGQKINFDQRAESLVWYPLRGASYGWMHETQSLDGIQKEIDSLFPVSVNPAFSVSNAKGGAIEALSGISIINPTDVSLVRGVDLTITYPNIFQGLKNPLLGTTWAKMLDTADKTLSANASGDIWVSWTAIAHKPAISKQDMNKYEHMSDRNKYKNAVQQQKDYLNHLKQQKAYWQQQYEYYSTTHEKTWTTYKSFWLIHYDKKTHHKTIGPWPDKAKHAKAMEESYEQKIAQIEKFMGGEGAGT